MVIALGLAVLFNFIILRIKFNKGLYADAAVDLAMLIALNSVFGGSILGVVSATAGSTLISLYLIWFPIKLFDAKVEEPCATSTTNEPPPKQPSMAERFDKLFQ